MALLMFALAACEKKPAAEVNGVKITNEMVDRFMQESMKEHQAQGAAVSGSALRDAVVEQMIAEELLLQGAKEAGVAVTDEDVKKDIEATKTRFGAEELAKQLAQRKMNEVEYAKRVKDRMMKTKFLDTLVPADSVTEKDMKDFYKKTPMPLMKPASVNIRFIQTATEEEAKAALKEIEKAGKNGFDKIADKMGREKTATVPGGYGWTSPTMFGADFAKPLMELKPGSHGGPYKGSKEGYYIIRVKERKSEVPKSFDEAKSEIKNMILDQKRSMEAIHWVAKKKKDSKIIINK